MSDCVDAVIVGAGSSGLSLAAHLADSRWRDRHVLIVDDGRRPVRDRSWALWTRNPGWLVPAVTASWDTLAVASSTDARRLAIVPYRYHTIAGAHLFDVVGARVDSTPHFQFATGTVHRVTDGVDAATVRVDDVDIRARWVFDSRGSASTPGCPFLQFLGWEVESRTDAFDPGVATFMDFRGSTKGRVSFAYVLPTTARRALVEVAEYRWSSSAADLAEGLDRYLRLALRLDAWTVLRTEAGVLPLQRPPDGALPWSGRAHRHTRRIAQGLHRIRRRPHPAAQ